MHSLNVLNIIFKLILEGFVDLLHDLLLIFNSAAEVIFTKIDHFLHELKKVLLSEGLFRAVFHNKSVIDLQLEDAEKHLFIFLIKLLQHL